MLLKSFADLSSTDVREDDTPLMGTHSKKFHCRVIHEHVAFI